MWETIVKTTRILFSRIAIKGESDVCCLIHDPEVSSSSRRVKLSTQIISVNSSIEDSGSSFPSFTTRADLDWIISQKIQRLLKRLYFAMISLKHLFPIVFQQ